MALRKSSNALDWMKTSLVPSKCERRALADFSCAEDFSSPLDFSFALDFSSPLAFSSSLFDFSSPHVAAPSSSFAKAFASVFVVSSGDCADLSRFDSVRFDSVLSSFGSLESLRFFDFLAGVSNFFPNFSTNFAPCSLPFLGDVSESLSLRCFVDLGTGGGATF